MGDRIIIKIQACSIVGAYSNYGAFRSRRHGVVGRWSYGALVIRGVGVMERWRCGALRHTDGESIGQWLGVYDVTVDDRDMSQMCHACCHVHASNLDAEYTAMLEA